jgi:predicted O-methyltransferase YrrM
MAGDLVARAKGDVLARTKGAYVGLARPTGSLLTRMGVLGSVAPDRDRRVKHWVYSLTKVHDSLAIAELGVPWWTYRAIDVVDAWLSARPRPIRVFEWGSGASTIWLAARADEIHSVEHHAGFGEMIGAELSRFDNVHFQVVEAPESTAPVEPSHKEGQTGLDFADYVAAIDRVGGEFDLIVIDGRAREACLRAAVPHLASDGIIVFDNTRRRRYQEAIEVSGLQQRVLSGLTPTLPYPDQTSLITAR